MCFHQNLSQKKAAVIQLKAAFLVLAHYERAAQVDLFLCKPEGSYNTFSDYVETG